jgi:hypothetical protein
MNPSLTVGRRGLSQLAEMNCQFEFASNETKGCAVECPFGGSGHIFLGPKRITSAHRDPLIAPDLYSYASFSTRRLAAFGGIETKDRAILDTWLAG